MSHLSLCTRIAGFAILSGLFAVAESAAQSAPASADEVLAHLKRFPDVSAYPETLQMPPSLAAIIKPLAAETAKTQREVGACLSFGDPTNPINGANEIWHTGSVGRGNGYTYGGGGGGECLPNTVGGVHTHPPGGSPSMSSQDFSRFLEGKGPNLMVTALGNSVCALVRDANTPGVTMPLRPSIRVGIGELTMVTYRPLSDVELDWSKHARGLASAAEHYGAVLYCGDLHGALIRVKPAPRAPDLEILTTKAYVIMQKIAVHPEWPPLTFSFKPEMDPAFLSYLRTIGRVELKDESWFSNEKDVIELLKVLEKSYDGNGRMTFASTVVWPERGPFDTTVKELLIFGCFLKSSRTLVCYVNATPNSVGPFVKGDPITSENSRKFARYAEGENEFVIEYPAVSDANFQRGIKIRGYGHVTEPDVKYEGQFVDSSPDGNGIMTQSSGRYRVTIRNAELIVKDRIN
ncbi:hypothetical protein [Paraburkholderia xenovorans]|uniref:hypothetical protein n=1 Tax=Paraburkholderia xenovorans TaxID=36873 RepID=UPI0038BCDC6C